MSEVKNLTKNTIIFAIGGFSVKIIQFFLMPLVTGVMSTDNYGLAESLVSLVELILPILTLGLQDAVFRFCMLKDISPKSVLSSSMFVVIIGFTIIALGVGLACLKFDAINCLLFGGLYIAITLSNVWGQFVRGSGRIKTYAFSGIVQALMLAGATYVFVFKLRHGTYGYMLSMLIGYASSLLILFIGGKIYKNLSIKAFDAEVLKRMFKYALPLIPNMLCWWFIQVVNRFILMYFAGNGASGIFIATSKISSLINIFGTIFLQAWTISSINMFSQEKNGEFNTEVLKAYSVFLQLVSAGIFLILPLISGFLLKGEFASSWRYSSLSIYTAVISCYVSFFGAFYGAALQTKMVFISTLIGAIVNVLACVILTPFLGILGALLASLLSYFSLAIIRAIDTQKYSNIKFNWWKESIVLLILLGQAFFILYSNNIEMWIYYVVQASIILILILFKLKDLLNLLRQIIVTIKKLMNKNKETANP